MLNGKEYAAYVIRNMTVKVRKSCGRMCCEPGSRASAFLQRCFLASILHSVSGDKKPRENIGKRHQVGSNRWKFHTISKDTAYSKLRMLTQRRGVKDKSAAPRVSSQARAGVTRHNWEQSPCWGLGGHRRSGVCVQTLTKM